MSDVTKDRTYWTITALSIVGSLLLFVVLVLGFSLWQVRREAGVQRQIIADMQRDDEGYIATMQQIAAERDANLAEVGRLQTLLATSQDDRARLLDELAQTQTERDLYRFAYDAVLSDFDTAYSLVDPFDCWPITSSPVRCPVPDEAPVLDEGEEAIVWCLDTGVVMGYLDECVEMYLAGNP